MSLNKHDIQTAQGKISVCLSKGEPTFVFIHGLGGAKNLYCDAFNVMGKEGMGVVTLDLLGFGDSEKFDSSENYTVACQANAINSVFNTLNISNCYLVLHSMASALLPELLQNDIPSIKGIILLEGNLVEEDAGWSSEISTLNDNEFNLYVKRLQKHSAKIIGMQLHSKADMSQLQDWSRCFTMMDANAFRVMANECWAATKSGLIIDALKKYSGLKVYWRGSESPLWSGREILQLINAFYFELNNAGHYLMLDNPRELYENLWETVAYANENKIN